MPDSIQHPAALSTGEKIWEGVKHIGKKALKWAAVGALVGGIALGVVPAIGTFVSSVLAVIPGIGPWVVGLAGEGALAAFTTGAVGLGAATGIIGAIKGLAGADEAVQQAEEYKIASYDRNRARQIQVAMMQRQLGGAAQGGGMGVSPSLVRGREQEGQGMGRV